MSSRSYASAVTAITVREARPGDGAGIARAHLDSAAYYVRLAPDVFRMPDEDGLVAFVEPRADAGSSDSSLELVAEVTGQIAGHLEAQLLPPDATARWQILPDLGATRLVINALATADAYKRRGVATRLVEAAEAWGREHGASVAVCDTYLNSPVSVPFWEGRMRYARRSIVFRKPLDP
jgi:GNAT superfamily N-acetyltransferase